MGVQIQEEEEAKAEAQGSCQLSVLCLSLLQNRFCVLCLFCFVFLIVFQSSAPFTENLS